MLPLPHASPRNSRTRSLFFSSTDTGPPSHLQIANSHFRQRVHTLHDATWGPPAHRLKAYSPEFREDKFSEGRLQDSGKDRALHAILAPLVCFPRGLIARSRPAPGVLRLAT